MSKKKTEAEMRAIAEMIKNMVKDWNEDEEKEPDPCENCEVHYCNDCPHWHDDEAETEEEEEDEEEDEEEEDEEEQYYRYPECECVDGECDQCDHWVNTDYCELDDIYENCEGHELCGCSDEDCENCKYWNWDELYCELNSSNSNNDKDMYKGSKEHTQTEELSKFIISVNTVLGGDMGMVVFDKSNKKDMEKLAAIFGNYAKRL